MKEKNLVSTNGDDLAYKKPLKELGERDKAIISQNERSFREVANQLNIKPLHRGIICTPLPKEDPDSLIYTDQGNDDRTTEDGDKYARTVLAVAPNSSLKDEITIGDKVLIANGKEGKLRGIYFAMCYDHEIEIILK